MFESNRIRIIASNVETINEIGYCVWGRMSIDIKSAYLIRVNTKEKGIQPIICAIFVKSIGFNHRLLNARSPITEEKLREMINYTH